MKFYNFKEISKSPRIDKLKEALFASMPEIEADRAVLLTESYKQTENLPIIERRAKALRYILENIPITIRDNELIVGSATKSPRGCQTFPEFSYKWLEDEFETIATRSADPFYISEETKSKLKEAYAYWDGKTTSDLATSFMAPETLTAMEHNIFTPGNYFYNGVGHVTVNYGEILKSGLNGIKEKAIKELERCSFEDEDYITKSSFLKSVIESLDAVMAYSQRYASLAMDMASKETDSVRKDELKEIARVCSTALKNGATSFHEACQAFWFVQMVLQTESSGHSISPGRFEDRKSVV